MAKLPSASSVLPQAGRRIGAAVKTTDPFYLSAEWRELVTIVRQQRGYVCEACGQDMSSNRRALIADHIRERKDGGQDLDPANVRLLCLPCHNHKTAQASKARRSG